ncbi:hypothetical protein OO012_07020 [Rhodobacteraceae bacterium KMM 6894]|nr:hypothetical protein [Rhodobacteraceae bacterium KMM 6894]
MDNLNVVDHLCQGNAVHRQVHTTPLGQVYSDPTDGISAAIFHVRLGDIVVHVQKNRIVIRVKTADRYLSIGAPITYFEVIVACPAK